MKKIRTLLLLLPLFLTGCKVGNVSRSGGMENESYLQFVQGGTTQYKAGVQVYIDENPVFTATVNEIGKYTVKGNTYAVKPGTRHVKVVYNNNVLFEKDIMVATQETKQVKLP